MQGKGDIFLSKLGIRKGEGALAVTRLDRVFEGNGIQQRKRGQTPGERRGMTCPESAGGSQDLRDH